MDLEQIERRQYAEKVFLVRGENQSGQPLRCLNCGFYLFLREASSCRVQLDLSGCYCVVKRLDETLFRDLPVFSQAVTQPEIRNKLPIGAAILLNGDWQVGKGIHQHCLPDETERLPHEGTDRISNHKIADLMPLTHNSLLNDKRELYRIYSQMTS